MRQGPKVLMKSPLLGSLHTHQSAGKLPSLRKVIKKRKREESVPYHFSPHEASGGVGHVLGMGFGLTRKEKPCVMTEHALASGSG